MRAHVWHQMNQKSQVKCWSKIGYVIVEETNNNEPEKPKLELYEVYLVKIFNEKTFLYIYWL